MENASVPVGAGSPAITMVDLPPQSRAVVAAMCLSEDRVMATRRMPVELQRTQDRAPPARRIASCARSYVCFGPVTPVADARDRLVHTTLSRAMPQGVRAQIPQA